MPSRKSSSKKQQSSPEDEKEKLIAELGLNKGVFSEEEFVEFIEPEHSVADDEVIAVEAEVVSLTDEEAQLKIRLEQKVERAFYEAGLGLQELRDKNLYRDTHSSFEEYCQERFGHSRQKANYLIAAALVYQNLTTNCCQILPASEYQVRYLTQLEVEEQPKIWSEAVKEAGNIVPSGRIVKYLVKRFQLKEKSPVPFIVGEVCLISSKGEPSLRGKSGCWAIVVKVHEFSCDVRCWNGLVEFVRPEYLKKLDYSEDECEEIQALCERLYKIREHSPEPTVYSFLSDLGKIKRSSLTAIEDRLLSVLEQEYGIFDD